MTPVQGFVAHRTFPRRASTVYSNLVEGWAASQFSWRALGRPAVEFSQVGRGFCSTLKSFGGTVTFERRREFCCTRRRDMLGSVVNPVGDYLERRLFWPEGSVILPGIWFLGLSRNQARTWQRTSKIPILDIHSLATPIRWHPKRYSRTRRTAHSRRSYPSLKPPESQSHGRATQGSPGLLISNVATRSLRISSGIW
jgi:hypothetical protein